MARIICTQADVIENNVEEFKKALLRGELIIALDRGTIENVFEYSRESNTLRMYSVKEWYGKILRTPAAENHFASEESASLNRFIRDFILKNYTQFVCDRFENTRLSPFGVNRPIVHCMMDK